MSQTYLFHGFEVDLRVCAGPEWTFPESEFAPLTQVHGNLVVERNSENHMTELAADGHWTRQENSWIGVRTADCVPLLVAHPQAVAALHAGWRGVQLRIVHQLYHQWQSAGLDLTRACWVAGPHITVDSFEVGPDMLQAFADRRYRDRLVARRPDGKTHFDLLACLLADITEAGYPAPELLHRIGGDTCRGATWPSYRRDGESAGRLLMSIRRTTTGSH